MLDGPGYSAVADRPGSNLRLRTAALRFLYGFIPQPALEGALIEGSERWLKGMKVLDLLVAKT